MDEIFGYFPPVANPPAKAPLLSLLKQARAFGLGIMLATQNPVDLDYKGLANTGTWFIGRLQTERDKLRVLEGLEGAAASARGKFDIRKADELLAGLGSRVFLMHNVHEDAPVVFSTRWAMSYLRGPLTRDQIRQLMAERKQAAAPSQTAPAPGSPSGAPTSPPEPATGGARPVLEPSIPQYFAPLSRGQRPAAVSYEPRLFATAEVGLENARHGVRDRREVAALVEFGEGPLPINWQGAVIAPFTANDLSTEPQTGASFAGLPAAANRARSYAEWGKEFADWLTQTQTVTLWRSPATGLVSQPGEDERDFRLRLQRAAREKRDDQLEKLRQKYAGRIATLEDRLQRAEQAVQRKQEQERDRQVDTAVLVGASILGAVFGRRRSAVSRAGTAARSVQRSMRQSGEVARARETAASVRQRLMDLEDEFRRALGEMELKLDPLAEDFEQITIAPRRKDIDVDMVALVWVPRGC